jgi:hypothetical protein
MRKILFRISAMAMVFHLTSCEKIAGPGGTSMITGTVSGINQSAGQYEVIEITVTPGIELEHGDYFIINQWNGNNFYFWFNNPNWVSDGNPNLQGRTGVQINFQYSEDNITIAQRVDSTLQVHLGGAFDIVRSADIISLTAKEMGNIPDPDDVTTSFLMDVSNQGELGQIGTETAMTDVRVYLTYGENTIYDESEKTGVNGAFAFRNLQVGKYTLYVLSKDSISQEYTIPVEKEIEITSDESVVDAGNFLIQH